MVMERGRVRQVGTPEQIYHEPADEFVADFIGTVNLLDGHAGGPDHSQVWVEGLGQPLVVSPVAPVDCDVRLAIRPERIVVHPDGAPPSTPNAVSVKVRSQAFLGDHYRYVVALGDHELVVRTLARIDRDSELTIELPPDAIRTYVARRDTT